MGWDWLIVVVVIVVLALVAYAVSGRKASTLIPGPFTPPPPFPDPKAATFPPKAIQGQWNITPPSVMCLKRSENTCRWKSYLLDQVAGATDQPSRIIVFNLVGNPQVKIFSIGGTAIDARSGSGITDNEGNIDVILYAPSGADQESNNGIVLWGTDKKLGQGAATSKLEVVPYN